MESTILFNGTFRSVLDESISDQRDDSDRVHYLQPYSTGVIRVLKKHFSKSEQPVRALFTPTDDLSMVRYTAEIVGWEDKRDLSPQRRNEVHAHIVRYQPGEIELYLKNNKGEECANLITVRNVEMIRNPFPVTVLIKVSDGKPHGIRSQAGGWSEVRYPIGFLESEDTFELSHAITDEEKRVREASQLSAEELLKKCENHGQAAERISLISTAFRRNHYVVAFVLRRADGVCEECGESAPFIRKSDGTPFLEVHHKKPLSEGGIDSIGNTVALCPNCHRRFHFG